MTLARSASSLLLLFLLVLALPYGEARADQDYSLSAQDKKNIVDYKKKDIELGKKEDASYADRFADEGIDVATGQVTVTDEDRKAFEKERKGVEEANNGIQDLQQYCGIKIPIKEDFALFKIMRRVGVGDNVLDALAGVCKVRVNERPKRAAMVARVKSIHIQYEGFGCKPAKDGSWGQAMHSKLMPNGTLEVFVRVGPWGSKGGCDYEMSRDAMIATLSQP